MGRRIPDLLVRRAGAAAVSLVDVAQERPLLIALIFTRCSGLRELRGEFVPAYPLPGRVLFRCFQYRAETGEFVLDWGFLLLLLPWPP